jgi:hypothetical protein
MPSNRVPTTAPQLSDFRTSPLEFVRMLYASFLQGLFNSAPPGSYHWEPDETTEIFITDENPLKAEKMGARPAITLARGPVQAHSLGFDDMEAYSFSTGSKTKSILVPGTMTIHCCSRNDLECERLAWVCFEQIWANREILMQAGLFEVGRGAVVGAPSPAGSIIQNDGGEEFYVVSVTSPFQFNRTTKVTPLGRRIIQGIELALRARLLTTEQQRPRPHVPATTSGGLALSIQGCPPDVDEGYSDAGGHTPNPGSEAPSLPLVPHPMNPTQLVRVRSTKPNAPGVKPPSIGGRRLPISTTTVEESCGNEMDPHVTSTSKVKA